MFRHFHYGQYLAHKATQRTVLVIAGTGGGKSASGPMWLAKEILKNPGGIFFIASPTWTTMSRATVRRLQEDWQDTDFDGIWNHGKNEWVFKNKNLGTLYLVSAFDWLGVQGFHANAGWLDELGQYSEQAYLSLMARLDRSEGRAYITTTPYSDCGFFADLVRTARDNPKDYAIVNFPSWWNPTYSYKSYLDAKHRGSKSWWNMMYNGELGRPEHQCCPEFDDQENIRKTIYREDLPIIVGCDFNNKPMIWSCNWDDPITGNWGCFDEIYIERDAVNPIKALDMLYAKYFSHTRGFNFITDATSDTERNKHMAKSDLQYITTDERFIKLGRQISCPMKNPGQLNRLNAFNAYIKNAAGERRYFIDPKCKHIIDDIHMAEWKPGTREIAKQKFDPHGLDCASYPLVYLHPLKTPINTGTGRVLTRKFN